MSKKNEDHTDNHESEEYDEEEKMRKRKKFLKSELNSLLKKVLILAFIIISFVFFLGIFDPFDKEFEEKTPYIVFEKMVKNNDVGYVMIKDTHLEYLTKNQYEENKKKIKMFFFNVPMSETFNPKDEDLKKNLLKHGVVVEETKDTPLMDTFAKALIVVGVLWVAAFLFPRIREKGINVDGQSDEKLKKQRYEPTPLDDITLDDVIGVDEAKEEVAIIIDMLKHPEKYKGVKVPSGFMFYGATGTGKTLLARAIANEAGVPMYYASASDFIQMYVGQGASRIRDLFQAARQHEKAIVFIDEIDAVAMARGGEFVDNTEDRRTLNALLTELDGFQSKGGKTIITIGATNRIEDLDEALLRPGRFDKKIAFQIPDKKDRERLLTHYLATHELSDEVSIEGYAQTTIGMSGADLAQIANEAALLSRVDGEEVIQRKHMDLAFYKVVMRGNPRKSGHDEETEELVAWHEAGHALLAKAFTTMHVPRVSIIPSTTGAGGATFMIPVKEGLQTKQDIKGEIISMYGGRIAEELLVGKNNITIGAINDIDRASESIKRYIEVYGMSDEYAMLNPRYFIEENEKSLDYAKELSNELYKEGYEWLRTHRTLLKEVAELLMERKTINENELDEVITKYFSNKASTIE